MINDKKNTLNHEETFEIYQTHSEQRGKRNVLLKKYYKTMLITYLKRQNTHLCLE